VKRKVLIIGIDGGTWTVLKPAMGQGFMPFLKSLGEKGASGILKSTVPAITPAAWGGFQTGKNPGKTGVFHFSYWNKEEKRSQYVSSIDLGETVWDILGSHGKRSAVLNVPMTYPPRPINGYLISGLLTPSTQSNFTWPSEFKLQLQEEFPDYHIFDLKKIANYRSEGERFGQFVEQMASIVESRTQVALWTLKKEPFDVFMVHFQASDVLQHVYWHFLDDSHPLFERSKQEVIFREFYQELDSSMKAVYDCFTEENKKPLTVVLSDHGFQSHCKRFNLGNWLIKEGYLKLHKEADRRRTPALKKITRSLRLGEILKHLIPQSKVDAIEKKFIPKSELFDWDKTRAYSMGRSSEGFIYLLARTISERDSLAEEIRDRLMKVTDPETGKQVAEKVWLKEELYQGPQMEHLPDMIIEPAGDYTFTGHCQIDKDLYHTVNSEMDMHIGKHHQDGIWVVSGDSVSPKSSISANIIDIAPTLLYYLGIPIPDDMDGLPQKGLFDRSYEIDTNLSDMEKTTGTPKEETKHVYSENDVGDIEQRLKDLGYL
jgi:predicted AlkP superfamily phosphohydrolase/phosphomutase